jgi:DNA primase
LGTACTTDHVQKLFRFTDAVVFSFDGDAAGRRAARKALDGALAYATDVRSVKFLFLPAEHDPDSYIREFGKEAFARCVSEATPLSRFLIDAAPPKNCASSSHGGLPGTISTGYKNGVKDRSSAESLAFFLNMSHSLMSTSV